jgi:hypothetical protein
MPIFLKKTHIYEHNVSVAHIHIYAGPYLVIPHMIDSMSPFATSEDIHLFDKNLVAKS